MNAYHQLPVPPHYRPDKVSSFWKVEYASRAEEANQWANQYDLNPAATDKFKFGLLLIDVQNTFCLPDFELFVAGRSGLGTVSDNQRLSEFIYHNLGVVSKIIVTMDTHKSEQIFHPVFLVNGLGLHPEPYTLINIDDIRKGLWKINPAVAANLGKDENDAQEYLTFYTEQLANRGKFDLTIWPYHAMLGGIGHALVSAIEEAVFFHSIARYSQPEFILKGDLPWTEAYSAIGPEVLISPTGVRTAQKDTRIINWLKELDALAIAGQAKSHCVNWTIGDLLDQINSEDASLASKVYLLEDCSSPVVIPGAVDFTDAADEAYRNYSEAGMHLVKSTQPISDWPQIAV